MLSNSHTFWSLASTGSRTAGAILFLPIALNVLSPVELGLYYSFLAISSLAILLDMGFSQTFIRFTAQANAGAESVKNSGLSYISTDNKPNTTLLIKLLSLSRWWYGLTGLIIIILLTSLGSLYLSWQIKSSDLSSNIIWCWLSYSLAVGLGFYFEIWRTFLFGIGRIVEAQKTTVIAQIVSTTITATCLYLGLGLWSFVAARLGLALSNRLIGMFFLTKHMSLKLTWNMPNIDLLRIVWPMTWKQGILSIGDFSLLRASLLIYSSIFGLEATAKYGLSLQILGVIAAISSAPFAASVPVLNRLRVTNQLAKLKQHFFSYLYVGIFFALFLGCCAIFLGPLILQTFGSRTHLLESNALLLLLLAQVLNMHLNSWITLKLTENMNPFVNRYIVSIVLVTSLSWALGSYSGVYGLLIAQVLTPLFAIHIFAVRTGVQTLRLPTSQKHHQH